MDFDLHGSDHADQNQTPIFFFLKFPSIQSMLFQALFCEATSGFAKLLGPNDKMLIRWLFYIAFYVYFAFYLCGL